MAPLFTPLRLDQMKIGFPLPGLPVAVDGDQFSVKYFYNQPIIYFGPWDQPISFGLIELKRIFKECIFASNYCRLRYISELLNWLIGGKEWMQKKLLYSVLWIQRANS